MTRKFDRMLLAVDRAWHGFAATWQGADFHG
ncbi:hypothetical protein HDG37_006476 [Paraburkholderia sp. MM5384-R2]|nr:hypothetical protein [Paraburkholderia sp. MM5384-R2]